ncbi:hypothetical protein K0M31_018269 [Melipona bicolor]|uniref:Uncharacterized protein n=1 Tax=Melipona bicolor TaxID=60889 RepID=A0AA40KDZ0_9HYME|nr:hypothetical protein K0M31_018269 [Melipona bicolor]
MVTCPSFADYGGPRCIFVQYPEANGRYMSKELRQAGKKNTRAGPVVTTSQSVGEEKIPRYRARDRIVLRSERHTEDSYLGVSVSMYAGINVSDVASRFRLRKSPLATIIETSPYVTRSPFQP